MSEITCICVNINVTFFFLSVFQKKLLAIVLEIREDVRRIRRAEPVSSASRVERMEDMDDFNREEERLSDAQAFNTLVSFTRVWN